MTRQGSIPRALRGCRNIDLPDHRRKGGLRSFFPERRADEHASARGEWWSWRAVHELAARAHIERAGAFTLRELVWRAESNERAKARDVAALGAAFAGKMSLGDYYPVVKADLAQRQREADAQGDPRELLKGTPDEREMQIALKMQALREKR